VPKAGSAFALAGAGVMGLPAILREQDKLKIGFHSALAGLETILGETQLNSKRAVTTAGKEVWMAKRILVATDFSTRSDRAIRRATILAKTLGTSVSLVHVIDDDRPERLFEAERNKAQSLLDELVESLKQIDHVKSDAQVLLGEVSTAIAKANEDLQPEFLVIGPHRHQGFRDIFSGTTAERTIRVSKRPVLMACGMPTRPYRHVLVALDLSAYSADALHAIKNIGLDQDAVISFVHVFDVPPATMMWRAGVGKGEIEDYIKEEGKIASKELVAFLQKHQMEYAEKILRPNQSSAAIVICDVAKEINADLLVVGSRGRAGIKKLFLGSVAEQVLRDADRDVLVVPPGNRPDSRD